MLCATLALVLGVTSQANAATRRSCTAFSFKHNGVPWRAQSIRTVNESCLAARALIKSYARPRNCQFVKPCYISGYVCRTSRADGSVFTETCTRPGRSVTWRGSYTSR